jgi:hypothetical protein
VFSPAGSVAEHGLGVQAWLGIGAFDPAKVGRNQWPTGPGEKPEHGFFTSSWDAQRATSPWIEYWATTPRAAREPARQIWLLHPRPDARLYVIDGAGDYEGLVQDYTQRYGDRSVSSRVPAAPYWSRIAAAGLFEGIHVTARAVRAYAQYSYARSWTVESTLWFKAAFATWALA